MTRDCNRNVSLPNRLSPSIRAEEVRSARARRCDPPRVPNTRINMSRCTASAHECLSAALSRHSCRPCAVLSLGSRSFWEWFGAVFADFWRGNSLPGASSLRVLATLSHGRWLLADSFSDIYLHSWYFIDVTFFPVLLMLLLLYKFSSIFFYLTFINCWISFSLLVNVRRVTSVNIPFYIIANLFLLQII